MVKPRLLVIGGKPFNIPPPLLTYFDIAKHIEQDQAKFSFCTADYILVITNWVNHSAISSARKALPNVPVIWVRKGWPSMKTELVRRGLITVTQEPPEEQIHTVVEDVREVAAVVGTGEEDPFANMTDEELEIATRPDPATASNGSPTPGKQEPKKSDAEVQAAWKEYVADYLNKSLHVHYAGIDKTKATEFFSLALDGEISREDLKAEFGIADDVANAVFVGFTKSRGQFRTRYDLPPIHTRYKPRAPRVGVTPPPPPPPAPAAAPIPSEVDRMLQEYMRLSQEKSKLIEEQHNVEAKIEAVNKQLEIMKPFAEHFKGLAAAAKKVREALEQQQKK